MSRCLPLQDVIQMNCDASMSKLWTRFLGGFLHNFVEISYFFVHYVIFMLLILNSMMSPHIYFRPCSYLKSTYTTQWLIFFVIYVFSFTNLLTDLWFTDFHSLKINAKSILCINLLWFYYKLFCNRLFDWCSVKLYCI